MTKVLIMSHEGVPVGDNLAGGPGIRYWEIAHQLARNGHACTLAVPARDMVQGSSPELEIVGWEADKLAPLCNGYETVVLPYFDSLLSAAYTSDVDQEIPTAVDVYDPVLIEHLNMCQKTPESTASFLNYAAGVETLLTRGDYFFCANERQYYYYLGVLGALGRINPYTYHEDMLGFVPFGVPEEPPKHEKDVIKGPVVGKNDPVILWFSGIYPWFDAVTVVEAMPAVLKEVPDAKLVIMGGVHPNLHAPADEYEKTRDKAKALGFIDKSVFFTGWRPYNERGGYYLEADVAVCTDKGYIETALSHRTRVIDLLWGGLPVITTEGDEVTRIVTEAGCGISVPVGDKAAVAKAVVRVLKDKNLREDMSRKGRELVKSRYQWDRAVEPLARFVDAPELAPDRRDPRARELLGEFRGASKSAGGRPDIDQRMTGLGLPDRARLSYREEGLGGLAKRSAKFAGRKLKGKG